MSIIKDKSDILAMRIALGEIELIFDTSVLLGMQLKELEQLRDSGIRMIASPYCAFEAIRHIDDSSEFGRYRALLHKIDFIGIAHTPNYESSVELGIREANRSQAKDKYFAAALCKYGKNISDSRSIDKIIIEDRIDGKRISLEDIVKGMKIRIREIHSQHAQELINYKNGIISFMKNNKCERFTDCSIPKLVAQVICAYCSSESMTKVQIEVYIRYYPHIAAALLKNFSGMKTSELESFSPPQKDGVDYRVTMHLGMEEPRVLVSNDKKMHINPLSRVIPLYDVFMKKLKLYKAPENEKTLAISHIELTCMNLPTHIQQNKLNL